MTGKYNEPDNQATRSVPFQEPEAGEFSDAVVSSLRGSKSNDDLPERICPDDRIKWLDAGLAQLDASGCVLEMSESLRAWLKRPGAPIVGERFWDLLNAHCAEWIEPLKSLREGTATFSHLTLRLPGDASRSAQWFNLELSRHERGCFVRLNSILPPLAELGEGAWDENLRTESAQRDMVVRLLRAESQLQALMERWPGVIFSQRADFTFRFVSAKIELLTGWPSAAWQANPQLFWQAVHPDDAEELRQQLKQARQTRQSVTSTYRVRHATTGRVAYVMEHRQPIVSGGGLLLGYEGVWLDVTRQTIAEKRLSSAAWKETLSVLTMGLAHDFSNVMAGIHALSESFLDQVGPGHEFNEGLTLIKKSAQQASHLVHRIVNLHQGKTGESDYHNLNEVAVDLADLIRKIIPRRMQFAVELSQEPLPVYIDVVELRQVVINLVLNAIDAMPQAGQLVLRTTGGDKVPQFSHLQGATPRLPGACLSIQDSGSGIASRHLPNIFDPFFTTKPMNKGSGLGLYNARLFVEKHRGAVAVDSTEGTGTTFHLWLPQADFTEMEAEAEVQNQAANARRSLLLAGQPGQALDGTAEFLRVNGYHVVTVDPDANGFATLRSGEHSFGGAMLLAEPDDTVSLALLPEVRRQHPRLKIILKVIGRDQDEMPSHVMNNVDMFISADLPQPRILEKLAKSFQP